MSTEAAGRQLIRLEGVHKWFGSNHVLRGIDLEVDRSEVVGIEYYSAASSPARLKSGQCSVMVIWTIWYRGSHH
jgi:polar amino acid transport system ATP-binding protein